MNKKALNLAVLASLVMVGSVDHGRADGVTNDHINAIIGDCGYEKYDIGESGAAGYCYVEHGIYTVENMAYGSEPITPAQAAISTSVLMVSNDTQNASDENTGETVSITPPQAETCNTGCNKVDDGSLLGNNTKSNDPADSDKTPPVHEPCVENVSVTADK